MEVNSTAREARILVESCIEALKAQQEKGTGASFNVSFQFVVAPGLKTDSETLSYLDKMLRAIKAFADREAMQVTINIPMIHPNQKDVIETIKGRYEKLVSLEESTPKLVGLDGKAAAE